jgi:hypothetical protein
MIGNHSHVPNAQLLSSAPISLILQKPGPESASSVVRNANRTVPRRAQLECSTGLGSNAADCTVAVAGPGDIVSNIESLSNRWRIVLAVEKIQLKFIFAMSLSRLHKIPAKSQSDFKIDIFFVWGIRI